MEKLTDTLIPIYYNNGKILGYHDLAYPWDRECPSDGFEVWVERNNSGDIIKIQYRRKLLGSAST